MSVVSNENLNFYTAKNDIDQSIDQHLWIAIIQLSWEYTSIYLIVCNYSEKKTARHTTFGNKFTKN